MRLILFGIAAIELALNKWWYSANDDSQIQSARCRLVGKVLRVEIEEYPYPLTLIFNQTRLDVLTQWEGELHCLIKAPIGVFIKLKARQTVADLIRSHQLHINGDIQVLQQIVALNELIDWQCDDILAPYVGDVAAYALNQRGRQLVDSLYADINHWHQNFDEVVKEEWLMLPNPLELVHLNDRIEQFARDVDTLINRVEKLYSHDDAL